MTRDERQSLSVQKWVDNKCQGIIHGCTGYGKTRCALLAIKRFLNKNPSKKVLIVVPNEPLLKQWNAEVLDWGFSYNCEVVTMNESSKDSKEIITDLLIIDECHKILAPTLIRVFKVVRYKMLLCLTATLIRVDGMHNYLLQFCPVVDIVTKEEAIKNKWLSSFREYKVVLDVDLSEYNKYNEKFYEAFSFFDYDFSLCMSLIGPDGWKKREQLVKDRCRNKALEADYRKQVTAMTFQFSQNLQKRKAFIANHQRKIEVTNKILSHYQDKKCITFSSTIKMAEKIAYGKVYSGKTSAKQGRATIEDFLKPGSGVINTVMKLNEGFNCPEASIAVILGFDSSQTKKEQRLGRVLRIFEGKEEAIIFTLVIKNTVEEKWYQNSSTGNYITIDEEGLDKLLSGEQYTPKREKETQMTFRF